MENNLDNGFIHALKQGEDIWLLAELYYGKAELWPVIYHANIKVLGDDPENTVPGLKMFIPYLDVHEESLKVPDFIARIAADPSYDPMTLLAQDRYNDASLCFDLYEFNRWPTSRALRSGETIRYFARASKPAMRMAERWREIFYRSR